VCFPGYPWCQASYPDLGEYLLLCIGRMLCLIVGHVLYFNWIVVTVFVLRSIVSGCLCVLYTCILGSVILVHVCGRVPGTVYVVIL